MSEQEGIYHKPEITIDKNKETQMCKLFIKCIYGYQIISQVCWTVR